MSELKVGDRVRLLEDHVLFTDDTHQQTVTLEAGVLGVVVDDDDDACKYDEVPGPYRVKWDNGMESAYFDEDIQLATAKPADAMAVDERSMLVFHDIEEANLAVDTANDEIAELQRQLAAAQAREKMLLASLHNIRDIRVNPTGNDDADRGRRDGYRVTTELAQAAINAHAKALQATSD